MIALLFQCMTQAGLPVVRHTVQSFRRIHRYGKALFLVVSLSSCAMARDDIAAPSVDFGTRPVNHVELTRAYVAYYLGDDAESVTLSRTTHQAAINGRVYDVVCGTRITPVTGLIHIVPSTTKLKVEKPVYFIIRHHQVVDAYLANSAAPTNKMAFALCADSD